MDLMNLIAPFFLLSTVAMLCLAAWGDRSH